MDTYTEHAVEVYTENAGVNINIDMKQAENFILREKQAENFMTEVVSQPTTMTSKVVIIDNVVQYVAVECARAEVEDRFSAPLSLTRVSVTEVEDRFSAPLSLTRVSVTRDSSEYSTREEVLAEQLTEQLEVFPPTRELRGGRVDLRVQGVHRLRGGRVYQRGRAEEQEGVRGQVGEGVEEEGDVDVLKDADKPHLPTFPLPGVLDAEAIQSFVVLLLLY